MTTDHPLNTLLMEANSAPLDGDTLSRFDTYLELLLRWNARTNLTAIRTADGILRRHFLESILAARALPAGIGTLLDFGSGAGFPGLPIALCRMEIAVTLAESQNKKAAFLREATRTLGLSVAVHAARAETVATRFDCVTLRAVDRMEQAIAAAVSLVVPGGWLAVLTTGNQAAAARAAADTAGSATVAPTPDGSNGTVSHKSIYGILWNPEIQLLKPTSELLLLGQTVFA